MENDKKRLENFADALFTNLWLAENVLCERNAAEVIQESSKLVVEVAKAVAVLTSLTNADLNEGLERYFSKHGITRRSVFSFIATYCFKYHANNEDIFSVFLKTCAFVYKVVVFCHAKGHKEYLDFASMCWMEVFSFDLEKDFYEKGGWEKLEQYVAAKSYLIKHKDSQHKSVLTFFDDIIDLFPNLKVSPETVPVENLAASNCNVILQNNGVNNVNNLFEINVSNEEAINAYKLITSFYGLNGIKSICEPTDETPCDADMEHVFSTLSYFISQGLLHIEASTGKIIQPSVIHNTNIHNASVRCSNCLQEANDTLTHRDPNQYPSSFAVELVANEVSVPENKVDNNK